MTQQECTRLENLLEDLLNDIQTFRKATVAQGEAIRDLRIAMHRGFDRLDRRLAAIEQRRGKSAGADARLDAPAVENLPGSEHLEP